MKLEELEFERHLLNKLATFSADSIKFENFVDKLIDISVAANNHIGRLSSDEGIDEDPYNKDLLEALLRLEK